MPFYLSLAVYCFSGVLWFYWSLALFLEPCLCLWSLAVILEFCPRYPFYDHTGTGYNLYGYGGEDLYEYTTYNVNEGAY